MNTYTTVIYTNSSFHVLARDLYTILSCVYNGPIEYSQYKSTKEPLIYKRISLKSLHLNDLKNHLLMPVWNWIVDPTREKPIISMISNCTTYYRYQADSHRTDYFYPALKKCFLGAEDLAFWQCLFGKHEILSLTSSTPLPLKKAFLSLKYHSYLN